MELVFKIKNIKLNETPDPNWNKNPLNIKLLQNVKERINDKIHFENNEIYKKEITNKLEEMIKINKPITKLDSIFDDLNIKH